MCHSVTFGFVIALSAPGDSLKKKCATPVRSRGTTPALQSVAGRMERKALMQRVIGHYLTRAMAVLGLVEAALSFAAIYAVLTLAGSSASLPIFIETMPHDSVVL